MVHFNEIGLGNRSNYSYHHSEERPQEEGGRRLKKAATAAIGAKRPALREGQTDAARGVEHPAPPEGQIRGEGEEKIETLTQQIASLASAEVNLCLV